MPPKLAAAPDAQGIDLRRMMKSVEGRWFLVPFVIAVLVITGIGLVTTLLQVDDRLPAWAYTAPAAGAVSIYFGLQLRQVWHVHIHDESTRMTGSVGVARQNVSGSAVAPVIHGDHNVVTVGRHAHVLGPQEERKARVQYARADPLKPPAEGWYRIEVVNPSPTQTAVITGVELSLWAGPGGRFEVVTSLGLPLHVEAPRGDAGDVGVGSIHLVKTANVEVLAGRRAAFFVKISPKWETYLVRASIHIFGPALEELHVTDDWLTPTGYAWNLSDHTTPPPPNPFPKDARRP